MKGGQGKDARGVTAIRQVAGANLAYRFLPANQIVHLGENAGLQFVAKFPKISLTYKAFLLILPHGKAISNQIPMLLSGKEEFSSTARNMKRRPSHDNAG